MTAIEEPVTQEGARDDGKDFVEHLRTVQFTLLAVCLGLTVAVTSAGNSQINSAHQQIKDIVEVQRLWDYSWITEEIQRIGQDHIKHSAPGLGFQLIDPPKAIEVSRNKYNLVFRNAPALLIPPVDPKSYEYSFDVTDPEFEFLARKRAPNTLSAFRNLWEYLSHAKLKSVTNLEEVAITSKGRVPHSRDPEVDFVLFEQMESKLTSWRAISPSPDYPTLELSFKQFSSGNLGFLKRRFGKFPYSHAYVGIPPSESPDSSTTRRIALLGKSWVDQEENLQGALIRRYPERWRRGSFDESFGELNHVTADFQNIPLDTIEKIVRAEKERSKDAFEAFGVKFPVEATAKWGSILILGLQMYFWLHLREYRLRQLKSVSVAWIGSYAGVLPRLIFCVTTLLIPIAVMVLLARQVSLGFPQFSNITTTLCLGAVSLLLSTLIGWQYLRLSVSHGR